MSKQYTDINDFYNDYFPNDTKQTDENIIIEEYITNFPNRLSSKIDEILARTNI